jgi:hypothetical protein
MAEQVSNALWGLEYLMDTFEPEGAWPEGATYWLFCIAYFTNFLTTLENCTGDLYNFLDPNGIKVTPLFITQAVGPNGSFNFGDGGNDLINSPELLWFAKKLNMHGLLKYRQNFVRDHGLNPTVKDMIFYQPDYELEDGIDLPLDRLFHGGAGVAYLRSGFENNDVFFAGLHGGDNGESHGHIDMGEFVLDAKGERWFRALGADSYSLPHWFNDGMEYVYYRMRAEGHNTILVNPDKYNKTPDEGGFGDQNRKAAARNVDFLSKPRGGLSIIDITEAYKEDTNSLLRGIMLTDDRQTFVVRDEFDLKGPSRLCWFGHTDANITILTGGREAVLESKGKYCYVKLDTDVEGAVFTQGAAVPYIFDHPELSAGQNPNTGVKKLIIDVNSVTSGYFNITCIPMKDADAVPEEGTYAEPIELADWAASIPDGEIQIPGTDSIVIDGQKLEEYKAGVTSYRVGYTELPGSVPVVGGISDNYNVAVEQAESVPGYAYITVADKQNPKKKVVYTIEFAIAPVVGTAPAGAAKAAIVDAWASEESQADLGYTVYTTFDGDINGADKRWSAEGDQWIVYDLGSVKNISHIGTAWYHGDTRTYRFTIEVSGDNVNFTPVYDVMSTGYSNELEYYSIGGVSGRYVRLYCHGSQENAWNSLAETEIYVK